MRRLLETALWHLEFAQLVHLIDDRKKKILRNPQKLLDLLVLTDSWDGTDVDSVIDGAMVHWSSTYGSSRIRKRARCDVGVAKPGKVIHSRSESAWLQSRRSDVDALRDRKRSASMPHASTVIPDEERLKIQKEVCFQEAKRLKKTGEDRSCWSDSTESS